MDSKTIDRWADLLVDYCLGVRAGESILVASELEALPLVSACCRAVVLRGAHPVSRLEIPGLHEFILEHGTEAQLDHLPPTALFDAASVDARIRITAESGRDRPGDPAKQAAVERAHRPIRRQVMRKRWVLTQYPTPFYAAQSGLPADEYQRFVASAMFLDRDDPVSAWKELGARQAGLVEYMNRVSEIRVEGPGTDISLRVAGRTWINSDGKRNMPSGEIFTGPIEDSATGHIRCAFPVSRDGRRLSGIELRFEHGKVVSARADEGEEYLLSMLDLDPGARLLGELGIGLNYGIDRFTGTILYDEKIGGTVHLALGQSYPETGGTNQSALHWDLIVDLRSEGRVVADGRTVMTDGRWLVP